MPSPSLAYTTVPCVLGTLLVAGNLQGICAVSLGDQSDALISELQMQQPQALLTPGADPIAQWAQQIAAQIAAPQHRPSLPLVMQGTAFERQVWQTLIDIPCGTTLSYTALAMRVGTAQSVRAVARACAANRLAVVVPCHRVIRLDGKLSGYRWGVQRKQALLHLEAQTSES